MNEDESVSRSYIKKWVFLNQKRWCLSLTMYIINFLVTGVRTINTLDSTLLNSQ